MKIKSLIKVTFIHYPEKFGYDGTVTLQEFWDKIDPLIHTYIEPDTFKISNELSDLDTWGNFYAEQIKDLLS